MIFLVFMHFLSFAKLFHSIFRKIFVTIETSAGESWLVWPSVCIACIVTAHAWEARHGHGAQPQLSSLTPAEQGP